MRSILLIGLLLACSAPSEGGQSVFPFVAPLEPPRSFQVMVRGGMAGQAPANTRPAIALAIDDGVEWVAVDVRLSKDGQHVLVRDERLDDSTNGSGLVRKHTLAQLQKLDAGRRFARRFAGARLLSLDECLSLPKGKINWCLDCRDVDVELLVRQIKAAGMEHQVVVRGERELLERVRDLSGGTIAVMAPWHPRDGFAGLERLHPAVVEIDGQEVSPEACRDLHNLGILVLADVTGPADKPEVWDRALAAGADIVETDLSEELVAHVLSARMKSRPVLFACHRGASRYAPENTLAAFEKAYRLGADFVEFDVRPTRDGKYYLLHDSRLDRTTDGEGPIRKATSSAVDALDAGSWFGRPFIGAHVPSLDAFLSAVPEGVNLYFDAKDIPPEVLAAALAKHGLAERTVVYQSADYLAELKAVDSRIRLMPPAGSAEEVTALAEELKPYAVDTPWTAVSKPYIDHAHAAGIRVFSDAPFIVSVDGFRRAIAAGIDLIQTDHPLRLWRAMELVDDERAKP